MKKIICLFSFLCMIVFMANAQTKEEKEVAEAVKKFNKAMVDADKSLLEKYTADELSYGHSGGTIEDKAAFTDAVVNGPFDFITLEAEDQTIKITGDIALVRHKFVAKGTNKGNPADVRIGNLMVWQKQSGQWKLLARQAYKL